MEFEPDPIIWRYLDLAKFIHLIAFETLHFTRIDQFHDKFEGSYPAKNIKEWEEGSWKSGDYKNWRKFGCVSCWYQSDNESSAMWEIYGKNGQGIAIMSTVESLSQSLPGNGVIFQEIEYIDFINDRADIQIPHDTFKYKRIEFQSENEYRAALYSLPDSGEVIDGIPEMGSVDDHPGFPEHGLDVPVKLKILIKKIVLSPYVKDWYEQTVLELLKKYGLEELKLSRSDLSVDPVYPSR